MSDNFIGCAVCLNLDGSRAPATAIVHGYSVCDDHVTLASNPSFDIHHLAGKGRSV